jgi:hypothetical protein
MKKERWARRHVYMKVRKGQGSVGSKQSYNVALCLPGVSKTATFFLNAESDPKEC